MSEDDETIKIRLPRFSTVSNVTNDETNSRVILHVMQQMLAEKKIPEGYTCLQAEFTGSGDSTDDITWSLFSTGASPDTRTVDVEFDDASSGDSVDDWIWDLTNTSSPGWENNEGGYGNLTINFVRGLVSFELFHYEQTSSLAASNIFVDLPDEQRARDGVLTPQEEYHDGVGEPLVSVDDGRGCADCPTPQACRDANFAHCVAGDDTDK